MINMDDADDADVSVVDAWQMNSDQFTLVKFAVRKDCTTQLYRDYNKPFKGISGSTHQDDSCFMSAKGCVIFHEIHLLAKDTSTRSTTCWCAIWILKKRKSTDPLSQNRHRQKPRCSMGVNIFSYILPEDLSGSKG